MEVFLLVSILVMQVLNYRAMRELGRPKAASTGPGKFPRIFRHNPTSPYDAALLALCLFSQTCWGEDLHGLKPMLRAV